MRGSRRSGAAPRARAGVSDRRSSVVEVWEEKTLSGTVVLGNRHSFPGNSRVCNVAHHQEREDCGLTPRSEQVSRPRPMCGVDVEQNSV
jgi:hypothetical protein